MLSHSTLRKFGVATDRMLLESLHYEHLVLGELARGHRVCFCNDWDQIDSCMQPLHKGNVDIFQAVRRDEVEHCVNSRVRLFAAEGQVLLLIQMNFELRHDVVDDRLPSVLVVDGVADSRGCR